MRLILIVTLMLVVPPFARAEWARGPGWSGVKGDVSYEAARRELAKQGFSPVPILSRPEFHGDQCPGAMCRTFPEIMDCSQGLQHCTYLYRQRKTGKYWLGFSVGEGSPPHYRRVRYAGLFWADQSDLDEIKAYVLRGPDGGPFRYKPAPGKTPR